MPQAQAEKIATHTPGPYRVTRQGEYDYVLLGRNEDAGKHGVSYSGADLSMARSDGPDDLGFLAHAANCHGDLLAALENAFVAMGLAGANVSTKHPLRAAWEHARAAIAKATVA